jgi:hypothetical protein
VKGVLVKVVVAVLGCSDGVVSPMSDAMPRCDGPEDCSGSTPACKVSTGVCVECVDDTTCSTPV